MAEADSKEKILVAGGGLVGALAASVFADQGHKVDLYELRGDPRAAGADTGWELRSVDYRLPGSRTKLDPWTYSIEFSFRKSLDIGRSINLALSHRGRKALKRIGLEDECLKERYFNVKFI